LAFAFRLLLLIRFPILKTTVSDFFHRRGAEYAEIAFYGKQNLLFLRVSSAAGGEIDKKKDP